MSLMYLGDSFGRYMCNICDNVQRLILLFMYLYFVFC
uniref:Uncharacterized protein n=1 Tax=Arundo donax TaxID=35708 RepID=A0A0A9DSG3_ARUDO